MEQKLQDLHYRTDFQFLSDHYKQLSKTWPLFLYQKHSFNEEGFTGSEIMIGHSIFFVTEMANENRWQTDMY